MPYVLDCEQGQVEIATKQADHTISLEVDRIRQTPVVDHLTRKGSRNTGTSVRVFWPDSASSRLTDRKAHFLQFADDYTFLNPHLTLQAEWFDDDPVVVKATDPNWRKWMPSNPTDPHWYGQEHFARLASAHIAHDADHGADRSVREFVSEFRGMSGSAKQKAVLAETGLARCNLSSLANGKGLDGDTTRKLLHAIQNATKPVKPAALGVIGKDHLRRRFENLGCEMESFQYKKAADFHDGVPFVIEAAFGWCESRGKRRLVTGVNWKTRGRRVELNAFTSGDLVRWIEGKLQEHGIRKVVPDPGPSRPPTGDRCTGTCSTAASKRSRAKSMSKSSTQRFLACSAGSERR